MQKIDHKKTLIFVKRRLTGISIVTYLKQLRFTKLNGMKTSIKILSLLLISFITFSSCSKDDDPADNDLFLGKYEGSVSFNGPDDDDVSESNGSVTVTKVGNNYTFNFSDGIPTLGDITMEKGDNSTLVFNDGELGTIRITASSLNIAYARDNRVWTAECSR